MTQTFEEAVKKTVAFWSEKSFRTPMNQDNGDDSPNGPMAHALMNMISLKAQESVTDEKIKMFEERLTELLLSAKDGHFFERELDVDYHPCAKIVQAAEHAGLNPDCFPCKTFTRINRDFSVEAKYQYGGPLVKL
jgi:hypothetical protein